MSMLGKRPRVESLVEEDLEL